MSPVSGKMQNRGAIYTPDEFAEFLSDWAIRASGDTVLDLGTGLGAFVFAAHQRLQDLGCSAGDAAKQIFGTEVDRNAWIRFNSIAKEKSLLFPNVVNGDFFDVTIPEVDAVVGNPPYIRRSELNNVASIREKVIGEASVAEEISRLTDLYVYFLLHAIRFLRDGGRIAIITADSWLNVGYGKVLKRTLLEEFMIDKLISLDRPVFNDAQVKPVMLLATKSRMKRNLHADFVRVKNGLAISDFARYLDEEITHEDVQKVSIPYKLLSVGKTWGIHFKAPELYATIASHSLFTTLDKVARTQIGHQTLAKDFFVLSNDRARKLEIEERFLQPLAQSAQYLNHLVISIDKEPDFYIFYCADEKDALIGTKALEYIETGETITVPVRGKNRSVVGYHNKQRIQKSSRRLWYDLQTLLEKRGRAEILIPRLVYRNFVVYWNQAKYVPGELFIEFIPHEAIRPEIYLAILNSTVLEVMFRCHAQVYGGGTYNMNSGEVKNLPILDASQLSKDQAESLANSYEMFVSDPNHNRDIIDEVVFSIMQVDTITAKRIKEAREDLITIATATKHR